jgi:hypothetical protein
LPGPFAKESFILSFRYIDPEGRKWSIEFGLEPSKNCTQAVFRCRLNGKDIEVDVVDRFLAAIPGKELSANVDMQNQSTSSRLSAIPPYGAEYNN